MINPIWRVDAAHMIVQIQTMDIWMTMIGFVIFPVEILGEQVHQCLNIHTLDEMNTFLKPYQRVETMHRSIIMRNVSFSIRRQIYE